MIPSKAIYWGLMFFESSESHVVRACIIKLGIAKMNSRNSYLTRNKQNPNSNATINNNQGTVERPTIMPQSITKQQAEKKNAQEMIGKIMEVILRFENPNTEKNSNTSVSREILKTGGNNVFFNVLTMLLHGIDGCFKLEYINNSMEMVILALNMFGYKGNCSKAIFQPIGAWHTWNSCLAILEWFAELANFTMIVQHSLQEKMFEEDQNILSLNAFGRRSMESVSAFIQNSIAHLETQNSELSYSVESKRMAIRNLHMSQKEISIVEKQADKERELLFRTEQEVKEINGALSQVQAKVREKQDETVQALEKDLAVRFTLENLKYEITHQELPPDECQRVKMEIRNIKNNVAEINEQINEAKDQQAQANRHVLEAFTDRASQLRKMAEKLKASHLFTESDIKPILPVLSYTDFSSILKRTEQDPKIDIQTEALIESVFKEREFQQYFKKQEQFIAKYETKFMREEESMLNKEREIQEMENRESNLKDLIFQYSKNKDNKVGKNSINKETKRNLEIQAHQLEKQIDFLTKECVQRTQEKISEMAELRNLIQEMKVCKTAIDQERKLRAEYLHQAKQKLEDLKSSLVDRVSHYKNSLTSVFQKVQRNPQPLP